MVWLVVGAGVASRRAEFGDAGQDAEGGGEDFDSSIDPAGASGLKREGFAVGLNAVDQVFIVHREVDVLASGAWCVEGCVESGADECCGDLEWVSRWNEEHIEQSISHGCVGAGISAQGVLPAVGDQEHAAGVFTEG